MPGKTRRPELQLDQKQRQELVKISQSRTAPLREVQRAEILLKYADGKTISAINKELHVSRPSIYKCIDKALAAGIETGLKDKYHSPKVPVITTEAKAWVINLACTKPKDHGYAAEIWTLSHLAKHTRKHAPAAGHDCLKRVQPRQRSTESLNLNHFNPIRYVITWRSVTKNLIKRCKRFWLFIRK